MTGRLFTLGVYGFSQAQFLAAIKRERIDLFLDLRQRRGVRGSQYSFANVGRLTSLLTAANVEYMHVKDLAPSTDIRGIQRASDLEAKTSKGARQQLSDSFVAAYRSRVLNGFDWAELEPKLAGRRTALFCVEARPEACHRSLVAERLAADLQLPITDLVP